MTFGSKLCIGWSKLTEEDIAELDEKLKEGIYRHYLEKKKHEAGD